MYLCQVEKLGSRVHIHNIRTFLYAVSGAHVYTLLLSGSLAGQLLGPGVRVCSASLDAARQFSKVVTLSIPGVSRFEFCSQVGYMLVVSVSLSVK